MAGDYHDLAGPTISLAAWTTGDTHEHPLPA